MKKWNQMGSREKSRHIQRLANSFKKKVNGKVEKYWGRFAADLDEYLKKCEQVYLGVDWAWRTFGVTAEHTHKALLFDVEKLKPKECEHVALSQYGHKGKFSCNECGKVLEYRLVEV